MTREIKFRGLRTDGKGWAYGYLLNEQTIGEVGENLSYYKYVTVIPETVGQFIASNGKQDFYVGDIVVNPKGRKHTVVIWDNLPCLQYTDKSKVYFAPMTNGFLNNKTVIGNIHEKGGSI